MSGGLNNEGSNLLRKGSLRGRVLMGVVLGAVLSVCPIEMLIFGIPSALLVGFFFCIPVGRRSRWVDFAPTCGIAIAMMIAAASLSAKPFSHPVDSFPGTSVTFEDLFRRDLAYDCPRWESNWRSTRFVLPTVRPSRTQIVDAINQQTQFRARIYRCGMGESLLGGSRFRRISLYPPTNFVAQATL